MAIEESIRVLQEELESTERRLKYLADQVGFSTIDVYLFSPKPYVHKPADEIRFSEQLKTALDNSCKIVISVTLGLITLWPWIAIGLISAFAIKKIRNKRKSKQ